MCSNYLPASPESLQRWEYELPAFNYGEAFPGSQAPFLPNAVREKWVAGTFGLMPHWAKENLFRRTYNARSETVANLPSYRNAWKHLQLCVIPVDAFYEPDYETGRAVRWRIERVDRSPFGLAGIWERQFRDDGSLWWSFSMLTINADEHPLMRRFHRIGDEKRSIVVLADDTWGSWLTCRSTDDASHFLHGFDPETMRAEADPAHRKTRAPHQEKGFSLL